MNGKAVRLGVRYCCNNHDTPSFPVLLFNYKNTNFFIILYIDINIFIIPRNIGWLTVPNLDNLMCVCVSVTS